MQTVNLKKQEISPSPGEFNNVTGQTSIHQDPSTNVSIGDYGKHGSGGDE
jgi:hypothetical protein